jgi:ADP-ribose pyrophosphatase
MAMKSWKRIEPTSTQKVGWRSIVTKRFIDNRGRQHTFDIYGNEGQQNAAVIALTKQKEIIVVRQFRTGPERIMDELPGGGVDATETPLAAAERELLEETGYKAGKTTYLGTHHKDAYMNAVWHFFLTIDCEQVGEQQLDYEEDLEVKRISISQLFNNARHDRMTDAVAVLMAYDELKKIQESV